MAEGDVITCIEQVKSCEGVSVLHLALTHLQTNARYRTDMSLSMDVQCTDAKSNA